jgi:NDP-sugar pyrophosphorylase family protein
VAGIIGIPGRLQLEWVADFARNPRPTSSECADYLRDGEDLVREPFNRLIAERQLVAYRHEGFFRALDTMRDKQALDGMADKANMPWRRHDAGPQ